MNTGGSASMRLSRDQVRFVDRQAVERYGISGLVLMENAGRNAAEIIRRELAKFPSASVVCGTGNNGGDGCVIARHLHNAGWAVRLLMVGQEERLTPDTRANFLIARAMDLPHVWSADAGRASDYLHAGPPGEVIVDALLGTGFTGEVRSPMDRAIHAINSTQPRHVVAVDVPSGLDVDSGRPSTPTVLADITVTFVAEKTGFAQAEAHIHLGRVFVADIGAPSELVRQAASV